MSTAKEFAEAGGVVSYGADFVDNVRHSAAYVDRILKGAKPGELPVQQPVKFEFVINLKSAKAMGLTIPRSVLLRADEVSGKTAAGGPRPGQACADRRAARFCRKMLDG